MDALVPMASQPTATSRRHWMMRRIIIDAIRGHGTTGMARFYAAQLQDLLRSAPRRGN